MPENQEYFKKILKKNGLKVTTQRMKILEVLQSRPDKHLTAEEIYECVKEDYPDIGLATVYRTIQMLSCLKLIDKLNLDDGCVRYEIGKIDDNINNNHHHHHHLICLDCGKVLSFKDDLLETLETKIKDEMGFNVVDHEVKMLGYCNECNKKRQC